MDLNTTDTIPRASIEQILGGLRYLAKENGRTTFDAVRVHFLAASRRRAPNTATAMWTVARDVLTELEKLKLATVGVLPRKLSDVQRLRETPCEISQAGSEMAQLHAQTAGRAYDALLIRWLADHPYFRTLVVRLLDSPIFIPDVTNMGQLGLDSVKGKTVPALSAKLVENCNSRLQAAGWNTDKLSELQSGIEQRVRDLAEVLDSTDIDAKRLIDVVQDNIVLPALLDAEALPFDPVTFQHMLKCAQEFFCAAWTTSHPRFNGRVAFSTCEFDVGLQSDPDAVVTEVVHHGVSYAEPMFARAIREAYIAAAGTTSAYVSAYVIRAIVCVDLRIPLVVFARSLESLISMGPQAELTVYTELPFEPPPQGENYVEVGKRRIGRLKLIYKKEVEHGD
jgi:hypothetical protein